MFMFSECIFMFVFGPGDAMWHAGGRPARLAEEHCVSTLHKEQQTDHLVLAGTVTHKQTNTHCVPVFTTLCQ